MADPGLDMLRAADLLRILREEAGYSQEQLAELLSLQTGRTIRQGLVSKWETGQAAPAWHSALAWLIVTGHSPHGSLKSRVRALQLKIQRTNRARTPRRPLLEDAPLAEGDPSEYATVGQVVNHHEVSRWAVYRRMEQGTLRYFNLQTPRGARLACLWSDVKQLRFRGK